MNAFTKTIGLVLRSYSLTKQYGRLRFAAVLGIILLTGILQVIGVASVFPFFSLATDPNIIRNSGVGSWLIHFHPSVSDRELLILSGALTISMLLASNGMALINEIYRERYVHGFGCWLKMSVMRCLSSRPYSYFLQENSGAIVQRLLSDVDTYLTNVLLPLLDIACRLLTLVFLVTILIALQPVLTLIAAICLTVFYSLVFWVVRPRAHAVGMGLWEHNQGQMIAAQQFLAGIKAAMVLNRVAYFKDQFGYHAKSLASLHPKMPLYSNSPRYMVEPLAFGGMVGTIIYMAWRGSDFSTLLPDLAVMALASYKLLPTIQSIYSHASIVAAKGYTLAEIESELTNFQGPMTPSDDSHPNCGESDNWLSTFESIELNRVSFTYLGSDRAALTGISLRINRNEHLGIVGRSGSGKSTLVDLILGLHTCTAGHLAVNGREISSRNIEIWREKIGYVPQDIFLVDGSISDNIAFGIKASDRSVQRIRQAAESARILSFIEDELPLGFDTMVGERGSRISGGQRQRLGLARAFYNQPSVLILDEATSALDSQTEASVMETVCDLQGKLTVITIAHRLSALESCDRIIELRDGEIVSV